MKHPLNAPLLIDEIAWDRAGRRRTVALRGGGWMREELTAVEAPASFSYRLSDISGAMAPLVDRIDGRWRFEEAGPGRTTVTSGWITRGQRSRGLPSRCSGRCGEATHDGACGAWRAWS